MLLNSAKINLENLTSILTSINNKVNGLSDPNFVVKKIDMTANFENKFENEFKDIISFNFDDFLTTTGQEEYINFSYMFNGNNSLQVLTGFENKFENHLKLLHFNCDNMCKNCKSLIIGSNFSQCFKDCTSLTELLMNNMFKNCSKLANTDIYFNELTLNCQNLLYVDLSYAFHNCTNLKLIPSFYKAFENCPNLQSLNMSHMFDGCVKLREISFAGIFGSSTCKLFNVDKIFAGCPNLILYLDHYMDKGTIKECEHGDNVQSIYRELIKQLPASSFVAIKEKRLDETMEITTIDNETAEILSDKLIYKTFRITNKPYYLLSISDIIENENNEQILNVVDEKDDGLMFGGKMLKNGRQIKRLTQPIVIRGKEYNSKKRVSSFDNNSGIHIKSAGFIMSSSGMRLIGFEEIESNLKVIDTSEELMDVLNKVCA